MVVSIRNKQILSEEPSAIILILLLADHYGTEVLDWDLETVQAEVAEDFGIALNNSSMNKISAAFQIITSDEFYHSLPTFIEIANAIDTGYGGNVFDIADLEEVAWALIVSSLLWPEPMEFSGEIVKYMEYLLEASGLYKVPTSLQSVLGADYRQAVESLSEDPVMFNSVNTIQTEGTDTIDKNVKEKLKSVIEEIMTADFSVNKGLKTKEDVLGKMKAVLQSD